MSATARVPRVPLLGVALLACACLGVASLAPPDADAAAFGSRVLRNGTKGKDVRALQRILTRLGYATAMDGVFGPATRKNVKALERKQRWRVDGKVTRKDARRILRLARKRKAPKVVGSYYLAGLTSPTVTLTAAQAGTGSLKVIDDATDVAVAEIPLNFTAAGPVPIAWNGMTAAGTWAADGVYRFKLADGGSAGPQITGGDVRTFSLHGRAFPIVGNHSFGGAASRFGASRPGHVHQGQDVSAGCGQRLLAAEGGTVSVNAYQDGGAGNYLVVHGALSGTDYVYMHMKKLSWAPVGYFVHTGEGIGKVGNTGSSSGCHLHFERWSAPGWYTGGAPYDPLPELLAWDSYS